MIDRWMVGASLLHIVLRSQLERRILYICFLRAALISLASWAMLAIFCLAMILSFAVILALPFGSEEDDDEETEEEEEDREEDEAIETAAAGLHRLSYGLPAVRTGCLCLFPISARAPLVVVGRLLRLETSVVLVRSESSCDASVDWEHRPMPAAG